MHLRDPVSNAFVETTYKSAHIDHLKRPSQVYMFAQRLMYVYSPPRKRLQHSATHCNTLQHTATQFICSTSQEILRKCATYAYLPPTATHCNTLQHTATHCNTLQHTATHCNTLQHTATHSNKLIGVCLFAPPPSYGVAIFSRIDKITGLFCRIASLL